MNPFEQNNDWTKFWSDSQKSLFQAWAEGKPPAFAVEGMPPPDADAVSDLMRRTMEQWASFTRDAWTAKRGFDPEAMKKLFDPAEWKRAGSHFDMGMEKLTEGPTYATLWDLDKKMLKVQQLWVARARDVERYTEVIHGAWARALERFTRSLNDGKAEPITSGRQMLDLWLATANKSLIEMHRSDEFLEAQRSMTRSSAEYRLAERDIAEAFCEMHHIPTRTEMDEVQRTVTELRREVRALRRSASTPAARAPRPTPPAPAKAKAAKAAKARSTKRSRK
jgi:hypothetical protein